MANMFDWNALEEKIKSAMNENEHLTDDRSKALCAIAISSILDTDMDEAIDAITDGPGDRGIDAVFINNADDRNDIHLFQTKCVSEFERSKRNFPANEINKISTYLSDLLDNDLKSFANVNDQLKQKTNDALATLKEMNANVSVHFVGNMEPLVDSELKRVSESFARYGICFAMHDLESLADYFLEKRAPSLDREINVVDNNLFQRTDVDLTGLVCTIAATDIVKMITSQSDPNNVEFDIFDQNVRRYLKRNNRINKKIIASAIDERNHMFWYQNNGITMTCDKIQRGPSRHSPIIKLKNVQIVNGGQTSNCLFEAAKTNPEKIKDVLLIARIIETDSADVKLSIAESTNSQTPINSRDLRANDRQQRQFQETFEGWGYLYERKAREFEGHPKEKRIDALSAGQAYLAYGIKKPEVAKANRGRVFGNLYNEVFTENLKPEHLLVSIQLLELILEKKAIIRKKIKNKEPLINGDSSLMDGAFHALFAIRSILERNKLDVWKYEEGKKHLDEAIKIIHSVYSDAEKEESNFSSNRFFKDTHTKKLILEKIEEVLPLLPA